MQIDELEHKLKDFIQLKKDSKRQTLDIIIDYIFKTQSKSDLYNLHSVIGFDKTVALTDYFSNQLYICKKELLTYEKVSDYNFYIMKSILNQKELELLFDKFTKIKFCNKEELKDLFLLSILFFQREVECRTFPEIEKLFPSLKFNSYSMGMRIQKIRKDMIKDYVKLLNYNIDYKGA